MNEKKWTEGERKNERRMEMMGWNRRASRGSWEKTAHERKDISTDAGYKLQEIWWFNVFTSYFRKQKKKKKNSKSRWEDIVVTDCDYCFVYFRLFEF